MSRAIIVGAALLALALPSAADAQHGRDRSETFAFNPERGYIFFRAADERNVQFAREVTEARRAEWMARRAAALATALAHYRRDLPALRARERQCHGSPAIECQNLPPIPEMPTEANFEYGPLAAGDIVTSRRLRGGDKDDPGIYYAEVEPGSHALYGQVNVFPGAGNMGVCLCMGSVRFEVGAGQIIDIGELRYPQQEAGGAAEPSFGPNRLASMQLVPPGAPMPVPEQLAGHQIVAAQLHAAGKMTNDYHVEIDRLPAIPGVLDYDRDRAIDVSTAGAARP